MWQRQLLKSGDTKESSIVTAICRYLGYMETQGKLYFLRNNSGAAKDARGNLIRFGRSGSADIIVFFKGGETVFIEVKNEHGKLSESQENFVRTIKPLGYKYYIARSVDDMQAIVKSCIM